MRVQNQCTKTCSGFPKATTSVRQFQPTFAQKWGHLRFVSHSVPASAPKQNSGAAFSDHSCRDCSGSYARTTGRWMYETSGHMLLPTATDNWKPWATVFMAAYHGEGVAEETVWLRVRLSGDSPWRELGRSHSGHRDPRLGRALHHVDGLLALPDCSTGNQSRVAGRAMRVERVAKIDERHHVYVTCRWRRHKMKTCRQNQKMSP